MTVYTYLKSVYCNTKGGDTSKCKLRSGLKEDHVLFVACIDHYSGRTLVYASMAQVPDLCDVPLILDNVTSAAKCTFF